MKYTLILVMASLLLITPACKDKEEGANGPNNSTGQLSDADKAKLLDKVWYPTGSVGGLELEFLSDGTFRQALSLEGSWNWQNNGDTMNIQDYTNKKYNFLFDEISNTTIKYRSNGGGDNYQTQFTFSSTK